jgi:alpha-tubulin suppressor-like RCC1 family protein
MRALSSTVLAALAGLVLSLSACADSKDPFAPAPDAPQADIFTIDPISSDPTELVEITAGAFHTCVIRRDGRTYCWGRDDEGQVGASPNATCVSGIRCVDRPILVFSSAKQIDAGYNHTCAVAYGYAGFCWGGSRPSGQVGTGVYSEYFSPQLISGSLTFTSISAGTFSTCATTTTGMYCWGKMGPGTTAALAPTRISTFNRYSKVTVGHTHACAYFNESGIRSVDCWGQNSLGQAGWDPAIATSIPFALGTMTGTSVDNLSAQADFTCVDQSNTTVQCFGDNGWGTLGNGGFSPTHIPQTVGGGTQLRGVTTGSIHACALNLGGAGFCWGNGYHGQLGNSIQAVSPTPVAVAMPYNVMFKAIAAGQRHSCAIGVPIRQRFVLGSPTVQAVYCWGDNSFGQLGRGFPAFDGAPMTPMATIALP